MQLNYYQQNYFEELNIIIMDQQKGRGKNIKAFDKIKITHLVSGYRLHSNDYDCRYGNCSYNQGVGCHKVRDETDWFVILKPDHQEQNLNYHFRYGDTILLSNCAVKKYLHASDQYESQISKQTEVSVCENGGGSVHCPEDQWVIQKPSTSIEQYWSVGEVFRLKAKSCKGFLGSHKRKLKDSGDNEVFVLKENKQEEEESQKKDTEQIKNSAQDFHWIVSEIDPYLYSANITNEKNKKKKTDEELELLKWQEIRKTLPKKQKQIADPTLELLKFGNDRIRQIQQEKKNLIGEGQKGQSFWRKIFCCCPPEKNDDSYEKF